MAVIKDLNILPRIRDSLSYLYTDHCRIDQEAKAVAIQNADGKTPVPCADLSTLMLGPGTTITHAAVKTLTENGCLIIWSGEEGVRTYAQGMGETRSSKNLLKQAELWADTDSRLEVVYRMYQMRFKEPLPSSLTIQQIRGMEGIRVRELYAQASLETGVTWNGRSYKRGGWNATDPINRALSAANSCLYGICHSAVLSAGYSPALGFMHTGKMLSFVYDVADLYKADLSIPTAFQVVSESTSNVDARIRKACRDTFHRERLLQRIVPDIHHVLGQTKKGLDLSPSVDRDASIPGELWDPVEGELEGGTNRGDDFLISEQPW
jgi:CRISPR-associated protein Cas1